MEESFAKLHKALRSFATKPLMEGQSFAKLCEALSLLADLLTISLFLYKPILHNSLTVAVVGPIAVGGKAQFVNPSFTRPRPHSAPSSLFVSENIFYFIL